MRIFVAGGTGVLGRATVRALVEDGHRVRATARGEGKSALVRWLGAEPVAIDLDNPRAVRGAIAGCDALLRLTTKIPPTARMRHPSAWAENNRLRTAGARLLAEAALAEGVPVYVHESVSFVYADGGAQWLIEESPTDDGGIELMRATLAGEREADRLTQAGGAGVVLRFGGFYGADSPGTREMIDLARRRRFPLLGAGQNYFSSIYVPDAARAVVAALGAPGGVYNVCDDEPLRFADYIGALAGAAGASRPWRLPGLLGRWALGGVWKYLSRSQRVSNRRFREATGWRPQVRSARDGWLLVTEALLAGGENASARGRAAGAR